MLARLAARAALPLTAAVLLVSTAQSQALAGAGGGGPGSGGFFGGVQCGQSGAPGCTVTAGTRPGQGQPAGPGHSQPGSVAPGAAGASGGPVGCQALRPRLICAIVNQIPGAGGPLPAPPAPAVLAAQVRARLVLPQPVIRSSPAPGILQLTRLPTWLWISRAVWTPRSKTATVPGESVTATATPVSVVWHPGDGSAVTCSGPGVPYTSAFSPSSPSPDCGHTYTRSSAGQPGAAYHVTATITWDITWTATGGAGGALPPLFTTAATAFRVAESQAVNTSGGQ